MSLARGSGEILPLSTRDLEQECSEKFVLGDKLLPALLKSWGSIMFHRTSSSAAMGAHGP